MGRLFIIEGIDGSGKTTQVSLLKNRLFAAGQEVLQIKFPMYAEESSALIRMYLSGEFGTHPDDVNAYAASTFYAVDRYASYKKIWAEDYKNGAFILSDRYVTSNMIHQGAKLDSSKALSFFKWIEDFEYEKMGLPKPDGVFFLDVPPELSVKQVEMRYRGDESKKDIHEKDFDYLNKCYKMAMIACNYGYMKRIDCLAGGKLKSIECINNQIYKEVLAVCR